MFKVRDIVQRNPASPGWGDPAWYKHTGTIRRIHGPHPGQGDGLFAGAFWVVRGWTLGSPAAPGHRRPRLPHRSQRTEPRSSQKTFSGTWNRALCVFGDGHLLPTIAAAGLSLRPGSAPRDCWSSQGNPTRCLFAVDPEGEPILSNMLEDRCIICCGMAQRPGIS
jgi:hypothetical protein